MSEVEKNTQGKSEEKRELLWKLQYPYTDGLAVDETLEALCELDSVDAAAYFRVKWRDDTLKLAGAFPADYKIKLRGGLEEMKTQGEALNLDDVNLISQYFSLHCLKISTEFDSLNPIGIDDTDNPPEAFQNDYKDFAEGTSSVIAFPIAKRFLSKEGKANDENVHPLGILVLCKKNVKNFFRYDIELQDNPLLKSIHRFSITAAWNYLMYKEACWKNVYERISRMVNNRDLKDFFIQVLDIVGEEFKTIKYASIWSVGGELDEAVLIKQAMKDYIVIDNKFDPKLDVKIIESKDEDKESLYKLYKEVYLKAKAIEAKKESGEKITEDKQKENEGKFSNIEKQIDDETLLLVEKKSFKKHFNIKPNDKFLAFPILYDEPDDVSIVTYGIKGVFIMITSDNTLPFFFNDEHIFRLSYLIGNGMERVNRNKNRFMTRMINKTSRLITKDYIQFLNKTLEIFRETLKSKEVGIFIYDDKTERLELCSHLGDKCLPLDTSKEKVFIDIIDKYYDRLVSIFCKYKSYNRVCFLCTNEYNDCFFSSVYAKWYNTRCKACLISPIITPENKCNGLIIVADKKSNIDGTAEIFTKDDERSLIRFASIIGVYSSLESYTRRAEDTFTRQEHEIIAQARTISGKANELRSFPHRRSLLDKKLGDIELAAEDILLLTRISGALKISGDDLRIVSSEVKNHLLIKWLSIIASEVYDQLKTIKFTLPDDAFYINTDRLAVSMILFNLLKNAITYSFLCTPIRLEAFSDGANLKIQVSNFGIEIPYADIIEGNIWKSGWRSNLAKTLYDQGTGLGLRVVHHLLYDLKLGRADVVSDEISNRDYFLLYFLKRNEKLSNKFRSLNLSSDELSSIRKEMSEDMINKMDTQLRYSLQSEFYRFKSTHVWLKTITRYPIYRNMFTITLYNKR